MAEGITSHKTKACTNYQIDQDLIGNSYMNNESEDQDTLVAKENESTCKQRTSNVNSSHVSRTHSSLDKKDLLQVARSDYHKP